ncbi:MAG TPA: hypothetical protein VJA94_13945 [Candidatus Angelobacter sp.]
MTTTELIDRYLQAVGFWLPRKQKDDIIKELSEDLHSQIEEKEASLGRKLSVDEVELLLKQRGRPVLVANHYLPQQYVIGPLLFPIYRFVLMIVGLFYLVPWLLVGIALLSMNPGLRAEHPGFQGLLWLWSSWWGTAFLAVAIVTIVFAVLERVNAQSHFLEEWEPRKLPPVRDVRLIRRSSSAFEVAAAIAFSIWWIGFVSSSLLFERPGVRIAMSPEWRYFYWGLGLLMLVNLPLSAVNLVRPYWTRLRASIRLLSDLAGSALMCWMLKAHIFAIITVANVPAERTAEITRQLNLWMDRCFPIGVIAGVAILAFNVWRIYRVGRKSPGLFQQAAAMMQ